MIMQALTKHNNCAKSRCFTPRWGSALSVTFGDSSPKGGARGNTDVFLLEYPEGAFSYMLYSYTFTNLRPSSYIS